MATPRNGGLTLKQQRFVQELPTASSQKDAALKAGYSPAGAKVEASLALTKPNVLAALAAQNQATTSEKVMSLLKRKERLSRLAEPDPEHPDPMRAIDILNRMESVYIEKAQVEQRIEIVVHGFFGEGTPLPDTQPPLAIEGKAGP